MINAWRSDFTTTECYSLLQCPEGRIYIYVIESVACYCIC
uniref:Uncharacterized protein n=1 Tax=Anguilla anguilla TaxID=7936 RepID=A0A0E9PQH1_ANGAN